MTMINTRSFVTTLSLEWKMSDRDVGPCLPVQDIEGDNEILDLLCSTCVMTWEEFLSAPFGTLSVFSPIVRRPFGCNPNMDSLIVQEEKSLSDWMAAYGKMSFFKDTYPIEFDWAINTCDGVWDCEA